MGRYKVVVLEYLPVDMAIEKEMLKEIDADLVLCPDNYNEDTIVEYVRDADAIVTDAIPITKRILEAAKKCKVLAQAGVGVDNIDIATATREGIYVANAPHATMDDVADHAMALVLALQRKIVILNQKVKNGEWKELMWGFEASMPMFRLKGKTFGLVALGNIGRGVARRAQGFGCKIIAYDPFVSAEEMKSLGVEPVDLDTLLSESDYISIHAPTTKSTYRMFNEKTIGKMKKTAFLINTSRGAIVDQKALYDAVKSGKIAGAGIDVWEPEPPEADEPLFTLDNVICTPHIAGVSVDCMIDIRKETFSQAIAVLKGGQPDNWINRKGMSDKK